MDLVIRLFRLRKQHGDDGSRASSSSPSLTKSPSRRRPWQRSKKHHNQHRKDADPSSSVTDSDLSVSHPLPTQREQENTTQLDRESPETLDTPEQGHIKDHHPERKNSLEQELADEDHFDWNNMEQQAVWTVPDFAVSQLDLTSSAFPASTSETVVDHDDLASSDVQVSTSTPPLRHKSSSQNLRKQYLEDKPLPPIPDPFIAFPSPSILASSGPRRSSPSDTPNTSPIDRRTSVDLIRISDLLVDAAAQLRRAHRERRLCRERITRPDASVSLRPYSPEIQSSINDGTSLFGGSDSTTRHPSTWGPGSPDHTVSPTINNRGSPRESIGRKFARISSFARFANPSSAIDNGDPSIESIAGEPEVKSPWAMFDTCIKHDNMFTF